MLFNTSTLHNKPQLDDVHKPITDPDAIAMALIIQAEVFGFDYQEIVQTMGIPPRSTQLDTYLLRVDDVPACTAQLVRDKDGKMASLWNVATLPEYQKRGYATLLLSSILKQTNESGISWVHLMATREGEPLYKRMGFSTVGQYGVFEIPATYGMKRER